MSEAVAGLGMTTAGTGVAAGWRPVAAAALGSLFEWYDFYIYLLLAPVLAGQFFPLGSETAALLAVFATYLSGLLTRPLGALLFGPLADRHGRRAAFLLSLLISGLATLLLGLLPGFASIGWAAPMLLLLLRALQGISLGGGQGAAIAYVAEQAPQAQRGQATGWLQAAGSLGLLLALLVLTISRAAFTPVEFAELGWRLPFLGGVLLLGLFAITRLRMNESGVFQRLQAEGRNADAPLRESLFRYPNSRLVLLVLLGATAGPAVVWYAGHIYALNFLIETLKLDTGIAYGLVGAALLLAAPGYVLFGWLSDRIGRLRIIMAGCLLAAVGYFPLFNALSHAAHPALADFQRRIPIAIAADCGTAFPMLAGPERNACDQARDFLLRAGLSFHSQPALPGHAFTLRIGARELHSFDPPRLLAVMRDSGYPVTADPAQVNYPLSLLWLTLLALLGVMVLAPLAAFLAEAFPARLRVSSLSLPLQLGFGGFGGLLLLLAPAMVTASGNVFMGLWYPIAIAVMSLVVGSLFLRDKLDRDLHA